MTTRPRLTAVLLAASLAPLSACVDRATAPPPAPVRAARMARNPLVLVPVDLGVLGELTAGRTSEAHGINPAGDVVGWSTNPAPYMEDRYHAVLWRDGQAIDLGTLGGSISRAWDINPAGAVVGAATTAGDYFAHAFVWRDGVMTDLGTLAGRPMEEYSSTAYGIDPSGRVVGWSETVPRARHAVVWETGTITDLGTLGGATSVAYDINPAGVIVGSSLTAEGDEHAFVWRRGTMSDLGTLGGTRSIAYGINPAGDVVGSSTTAAGEEHAVLWRKGAIIDLGTLGRPRSVARGINPSGQVVGFFSGPPWSGAFLWHDGVMTELPSVLAELPGEPLPPGGAHAYAVNPAGEIVGDGRTFVLPHAALWTRR